MYDLIKEIPICLTLAGLLGLYIGYLLGKESCKEQKVTSSSH